MGDSVKTLTLMLVGKCTLGKLTANKIAFGIKNFFSEFGGKRIENIGNFNSPSCKNIAVNYQIALLFSSLPTVVLPAPL